METRLVFAERLKELRTENNLSKRELAAHLQVSHTTIGRWEDASISPTIENIVSVCEYFNVSSDYLLGLEN